MRRARHGPTIRTYVLIVKANDRGGFEINRDIWIAAGARTPFTRVDGGLARRDAIALGVPVLRATAERATGRIDSAVWGTVIPSLGYSNIARETWLDAELDPTVPTSSVVMQCSTSMVAAFDLAGRIGRGVGELGLAGGTESMTHVQVGRGAAGAGGEAHSLTLSPGERVFVKLRTSADADGGLILATRQGHAPLLERSAANCGACARMQQRSASR